MLIWILHNESRSMHWTLCKMSTIAVSNLKSGAPRFHTKSPKPFNSAIRLCISCWNGGSSPIMCFVVIIRIDRIIGHIQNRFERSDLNESELLSSVRMSLKIGQSKFSEKERINTQRSGWVLCDLKRKERLTREEYKNLSKNYEVRTNVAFWWA